MNRMFRYVSCPASLRDRVRGFGRGPVRPWHGLIALSSAGLLSACAGEVTSDEWDERSDAGHLSHVAPGSSEGMTASVTDHSDTDAPNTDPHGGSNDNTSSNPVAPGDDATVAPTVDEDIVAPDPPGATRVARLTHVQYDNTVSDLLYLDVAPSLEFPPDPVFGGYNNNADQLRVADRLGRDYRRSAETLARAAVSDPAAYAQLVTCDQDSVGCAAEFVASFGQRAYRRPLTSAEQQLYVDLFDQGPELVASADPFRDGVELVIEAVLQSPKFLYRVELSESTEPNNPSITLSEYELAQRLSYALWNTMPDEALFESAATGELTSGNLAAAVSRMVDDARTRGPVSDFHFQWLHLSRYEDLQRDAALFPLFSASLPLQEETLRFVEYIGFDAEKGFASLLTAPNTFVNRDLAALYGLSGDFGDELELVDLDPNERGGLLTQIGFLAANAYTSETSPIHRGVFINRTILCNKIPDPPSNLDPGDEALNNPRTTREAVEQQTSPDACIGCHTLINPPGFAFESFDPVGQTRSEDRGIPVDTTGELVIDGAPVAFNNAMELISALAQSQAARACYARNLLRYAYGRADTTADNALISDLAAKMSSDDFSIKDALADLAQTTEFLTRPANQD